MKAKVTTQAEDEAPMSPLAAIFWGVVILAVAGVAFYGLWSLEAQGGSARVPWWVALLYYVGGKWTVGIGLGLLGLLVIGMGVAELVSPARKQEAEEVEEVEEAEDPGRGRPKRDNY
jgi:MFS-type transporter involved in bile tolerance (Atg22 family)